MFKKLKKFFKKSHLSLFVYVFSAWFVFMPVLGTAGQVKVTNKIIPARDNIGIGSGQISEDFGYLKEDSKQAISQLLNQLKSMTPAELNGKLPQLLGKLSNSYEEAIKKDKDMFNALNTMKPTEFMDYISNRFLDTLNQIDVNKAIMDAQNTPITEEYVAQINEVLKENNINQKVSKKDLEQMKEQASHMDANRVMDAIKQLNVEFPNMMNELKSKYGAELDKRYATAKALIDDALKQMNNYKITKKDIDMLKDVLTNIAEGKTVNDNELAKDTNQMGGIIAALSTFFSSLIPNIMLSAVGGAAMGGILGGAVGVVGLLLLIVGVIIMVPLGMVAGALIGAIIGGLFGVLLTITQSIGAFFGNVDNSISIQFN